MSITKHNIHKHELIGMTAKVIASTDQNHIDLTGRIVNETKNTLTMDVYGKEKMLPKKGTVLTVELGDGSVNVDCEKLMFRPEDRIKRLSLRRMN